MKNEPSWRRRLKIQTFLSHNLWANALTYVRVKNLVRLYRLETEFEIWKLFQLRKLIERKKLSCVLHICTLQFFPIPTYIPTCSVSCVLHVRWFLFSFFLCVPTYLCCNTISVHQDARCPRLMRNNMFFSDLQLCHTYVCMYVPRKKSNLNTCLH
jgi:hypothetical protein